MNNFSNQSIKQAPLRASIIRGIAWFMLVSLTVLSLVPLNTPQIHVAHSDKWLHLLAYFGVSYWCLHAYFSHTKPVMIGMLCLGAILEILQSLTTYRYFEWLDMLMNTTGVGMACALFLGLKIRVRWLLK